MFGHFKREEIEETSLSEHSGDTNQVLVRDFAGLEFGGHTGELFLDRRLFFFGKTGLVQGMIDDCGHQIGIELWPVLFQIHEGSQHDHSDQEDQQRTTDQESLDTTPFFRGMKVGPHGIDYPYMLDLAVPVAMINQIARDEKEFFDSIPATPYQDFAEG